MRQVAITTHADARRCHDKFWLHTSEQFEGCDEREYQHDEREDTLRNARQHPPAAVHTRENCGQQHCVEAE